MAGFTSQQLTRWVAKPLVFVACLLPVLLLFLALSEGELGPNPVETVLHRTGDWALRFLLITLAMTPLRRLTGSPLWLRFRRMFGLYAFFYACLHFLTWLGLDQQFSWDGVLEDVVKRPYITLGFIAFTLLWPLALTSTRGMMRRLGRRWQKLHRLVYPIGILAVVHYLWLVKADYLEPVIYGLLLLALLSSRLPREVWRSLPVLRWSRSEEK